jgi:hypothetical protein
VELLESVKKLFSVAGLVWGLIGGGVGYVISDYLDFRSKRLEVAQTAVQETTTAAEEMEGLLRKFANVARGEGSSKREDKDALAIAVQKAHGKASLAVKQMPILEQQFKAYADSLVALQQAADKMTGPLDAKPFIVATSNYFKAKDDLEKAAADAQRSYLRSLALRF